MKKSLTDEQKNRAVEVMRAWLAAPKNPDGRTPREVQLEHDKKRLELIQSVLGPLLAGYLEDRTTLDEFKSQVDSINKRNEYWGFKGIKGQMFFNMLVNVAEDLSELDQELKGAITLPQSEEIATSRIRTFTSYVKRLGQAVVDSGGRLQECPKVGSAPFFVSYFWQIQAPETWPVYYTNSVQVMTDLNLWQPSGDLAQDYISFKRIHEELMELFTHKAGMPFNLYDVEHVFWFRGGNPFGGERPLPKEVGVGASTQAPEHHAVEGDLSRLPESYVPPIVQVLPRLARNDEMLADPAKASGTSISRALEKSVEAAFTILGYETKPLGQGQGRVPDGLAIDHDNSYAIIWDAKARATWYSIGTDDRTMRDYIVTQSRELRRRRGLRNVYYGIVSGQFADDYDDSIRSLKMETDISEVVLIEADALVAMVEAKLRDPLHVSLGPDGLQRLFTVSGVLTADMVRELIA